MKRRALVSNETSFIPSETILSIFPYSSGLQETWAFGQFIAPKSLHGIENIERGFTKQPEWLIKAITNDIIHARGEGGRDIRWPALKILLSSQAIYMGNRILLSGGTDGRHSYRCISIPIARSLSFFLSLSLCLFFLSFLYFIFCLPFGKAIMKLDNRWRSLVHSDVFETLWLACNLRFTFNDKFELFQTRFEG